MDLYPVRFSKELLDQIPDDERTFHFMSGQLANDLNILTKLLIFSTNPTAGHEVLSRANTTISMLMIKQLAGRLNEGWVLIQTQFSPLHSKYQSDLSSEAQVALGKIRKYFGSSNLINRVRNSAGFHADSKLIKEGYEVLPPTEVFVNFLSEHRGHCLYYSSELVVILGLTKLVSGATWQEQALDRIVAEITEVTTWMGDFILGFMTAFMMRYIAETIENLDQDKISIEVGPPFDSVIIPFFADKPLSHKA